MALSAEQKEANKVVRKARDAAYRLRRQEYCKARDEAERRGGEVPEALEFQRLDAEMDRVLAERDQIIKNLRAQIAALELQVNTAIDASATALSAVKAQRAAAWKEWDAARKSLLSPVEVAYSDVASCFGASSWVPPDNKA